jgi:hypothetical protein
MKYYTLLKASEQGELKSHVPIQNKILQLFYYYYYYCYYNITAEILDIFGIQMPHLAQGHYQRSQLIKHSTIVATT